MKRVKIEMRQMSYATREALKTLRTNILFCGDDKQVIVVTSSVPGEGKTRSAIELAYSFAELNRPVLLIDADMRKSVMARRLQIQGVDKGLSHFLSGQCTLAEAVVSTSVPKLHLLLAGPLVPNPTELLSSGRFDAMLESFRKVYDYIVIDTPPLGMVIDSAIVAKKCDGAVMVVESAKTKYRLAQSVKEKLENSGCPVLGVILNKVDRRKQGGYYNKYYGKKYGKKEYREYYQYEAKDGQENN